MIPLLFSGRSGLVSLGLLVALQVSAAATPAAAQDASPAHRQTTERFLPDDPIAVDPDRLDMPVPAEDGPSDVWDFVSNSFLSPADYEGPARNANTLEEVPNSSWYTNRHYRERMSLEALVRGPNPDDGSGPAPGQWTVVSTKDEGKSVGMQIKDARGDRYLLKFDMPGFTGLSTGAEVVATKLFHALGYYVPQNYIITFDTERLELGEKVSLSREELRELLLKTARHANGHHVALASKFLEGAPIGPFSYHGTRLDDANDVFPHESRRELRGLRVFAAWLNHVDARGINSLDMVIEGLSPVTGDSAQYVRHNLIDFGTTLGGGPLGPKDEWQGYEYGFQPDKILLRVLSLGFAGSEWLSIDYPNYPSIGHFEAEHFDPVKWKPLYPNPAFRRMDAADAFWAARQVMHFTDDELRAIVETGDYRNSEAAAYLTETLARRRDKIGRAYLGFGGGLDRFRVEGGRLAFDDLLAAHGLAPSQRTRRATWHVFDNRTGRVGRQVGEERSARETFAVPRSADASFLRVEIATPAAASTEATTTAYLRRQGRSYEVVGLERDGRTPVTEGAVRRPAATATAGGN